MPEPSIEILARGVLRWGSHLLLCENLKHRYLYLPGGHVEFGESAADALIREFVEETGLAVTVARPLAVSEMRFIQSGHERHELSLVFHVELQGESTDRRGPPPAVSSLEPRIGFRWIPIATLDSADLRPRSLTSWLQNATPTTPLTWLSADERP